MTTPGADRRPVGVTVAGWIWIVLGSLGLAGLAVFLVLAAVGVAVLREVAARARTDLVPETTSLLAVVVLTGLLLAVTGGVQVALGVGVLRGRSGARVLGSVWEMILSVPLLWTLFADIADPAVPLMSTTKALDLASVAVTGIVLALLWTERSGAWFRACAAERLRLRTEAAAAAATPTVVVPPRRLA